MKIGILTHFNSWQGGYALHVGWLERAKLLQYFNQDFDFLVNENCPTDIFPNSLNILTKPAKGKNFTSQVKHYCNLYREVLEPYDYILTADIIYQRNFIPQNAAIHKVAGELKGHFYHWIHSAWTKRKEDLEYPENLRYKLPPNSTIVYMNKADIGNIASMYGTDTDHVTCVYNAKDPRSFFDFDDISWEITKILNPWQKQVFSVFPHCATRMDAKGLDYVIKILGALKRARLNVGVVFPNANAGKRTNEIIERKALLAAQGLEDKKDFLFTSDLLDNKPLPRKSVADMFRISNLFVFASYSEVSPNILLEAQISECLCVLTNRVASISEFGGPGAVYFDASYKTPGIPSGEVGDLQEVSFKDEEKYFDEVAAKIIPRLRPKHIWQYSYEWIWENQFKKLLEEKAPKKMEKKSGVETVGMIDIVGESGIVLDIVKDLAEKSDLVVIRITDKESEIAKHVVMEATMLCPVRIIKATDTRDEDFISALGYILPEYVIVADEKKRIEKGFDEAFEDMKDSDIKFCTYEETVIFKYQTEVKWIPRIEKVVDRRKVS